MTIQVTELDAATLDQLPEALQVRLLDALGQPAEMAVVAGRIERYTGRRHVRYDLRFSATALGATQLAHVFAWTRNYQRADKRATRFTYAEDPGVDGIIAALLNSDRSAGMKLDLTAFPLAGATVRSRHSGQCAVAPMGDPDSAVFTALPTASVAARIAVVSANMVVA